jgi:hypothetical protein
MKYVIDEEELKDLKMAVAYYGSEAYDNWLKGFLMQTPIEEIASGEVTVFTFDSQDHYEVGGLGSSNMLDDYLGKSIKIYIQECK